MHGADCRMSIVSTYTMLCKLSTAALAAAPLLNKANPCAMPFLWCICDACVTELSDMKQVVRAEVCAGAALNGHIWPRRLPINTSLPHMLARNAEHYSAPSLSHPPENRSETTF